MSFSVLGTDSSGNSITVEQSARREGTYIIGGTGRGKSVLLLNLILDDIKQGLGVCVLDPHGDLITRVIECIPHRLNDIIFLDIANEAYPFGLNLYQCANPSDMKEVQYTVNLVMHIWEKLYDISRATPQMSYYLRNTAYTIIANPGYTMAEIPLLLTHEAFRKQCIAQVKEPRVVRFWEEYERVVRNRYDYSRELHPILNKLDEFLQPMLLNIVGQAKTTIDMRSVMDDRKILLVKLDARLQDMTSLLGSIVVAQILTAAYSRENLLPNKRKQFNVYADEFDWFATEDFQTVFNECRKYGIACTVAHQNRAKLHHDVPELARSVLQAATTVVFQVTPPDSDEMAGKFDSTPPKPKQEEYGKRKKQTPVRDVVGWLLSTKGSHPSPIVNTFASEILETLAKYKRPAPNLNQLLYNAMTKNPVKAPLDVADTLLSILGLSQVLIDKHVSPWGYSNAILSHLTTYQNVHATENSRLLNMLFDAPSGSSQHFTLLQQLEKSVKKELRIQRLQDLTSFINSVANGDLSRCHCQPWFTIDPDRILKEEETSFEYFRGSSIPSIRYIPFPGQEYKFYTEEALMQYLDRQIAIETPILLRTMHEIKQVMQALAQNPILGDSGEEITQYRPGPQKSHQERKNEIINGLTALPKLTAQVRLNTFPANLQTNVCQCCGEPMVAQSLYCSDCGIVLQPEYRITVKPNTSGMKPTDLDARISVIVRQNLRDGYLRSRVEVETEIAARQPQVQEPPAPAPRLHPKPAQDSRAVPEKPAKSPQAAPRSRQKSAKKPPQQPTPTPAQPKPFQAPPPLPQARRKVPKPKVCPDCSHPNDSIANFCMKCGKKL